MATFITSKAIGTNFTLSVETTTGYFKTLRNGVYSPALTVNPNSNWNFPITSTSGQDFTILSCLSDGTISGDVTILNASSQQITSFDGTGLSGLTRLNLYNNQLTSFDGTDLTSLTVLTLDYNQLTSFDGTGLSSLTQLEIRGNQLTSFDGTDLTSLTDLILYNNQLTSFDTTGLSSLITLDLIDNQLTSFDGSGLTSINYLSLNGNQLTPLSNNQILQQLSQNEISVGNKGAEFYSSGGRTSASNTDYDNLVSLGWYFEGLDLITTTPPTFITSKAVGETINVNVNTSTGYWKYNHNGSNSSVFAQTAMGQTITVANANGEFAIIPCLSNGTVSGDVTYLALSDNQLTSFDSTGLTSLEELHLSQNQLTSFDGTGLTSLTELSLNENQLTSFDGTDLSSLTYLDLSINQLTPSVNNQILNLLDQYGLENGEFYTTGGRTSVGTADYDALISKGWTFSGLDLIIPPTFITSKAVGESINIWVQTSTGFWKYNHNGSDSSVFSNGFGYNNSSEIGTPVTNANGEFTIIPCLSDGTVNGDITRLRLGENQLTSFDGTGLTSLTHLDLKNNLLTSLGVTGLSSLTSLNLSSNQLTTLDGFIFPTSLTSLALSSNQLTSFDGTGLSGLTGLELDSNLLTSFDGTGLSGLTELYLYNNLLTSFDGTGLSSLTYIEMNGNPFTPSTNNQILDQFNQIGLSGGYIMSSNGRTSASNADYDNLVNNLGWTFDGFDLVITPQLPTFITSKAVGETINIYAETSTGYWKYNHGGSDSSVLNQGDGYQTITVSNVNGEFTIISCDLEGNVSGNVTQLSLQNNQLTSFDGTGLSSLTFLGLGGNQLTSFDGTDLSVLTQLNLLENQLTSFDGTGLSVLTWLNLQENQLTSFDGTGLSSLTTLGLGGNQLTSFDGTDLSSLTDLSLYNNQLTSFDSTVLPSLTTLYLSDNQLTSFDVTGLSSLTYLEINGNPFTPSVNNQILNQLNQNGLSGGEFYSSNGRTSASNTDYDNLLNNLGWYFEGLDLPIVGNGKLRIKGITSGGGTTTTTTTQMLLTYATAMNFNAALLITPDDPRYSDAIQIPIGGGLMNGYFDEFTTLSTDKYSAFQSIYVSDTGGVPGNIEVGSYVRAFNNPAPLNNLGNGLQVGNSDYIGSEIEDGTWVIVSPFCYGVNNIFPHLPNVLDYLQPNDQFPTGEMFATFAYLGTKIVVSGGIVTSVVKNEINLMSDLTSPVYVAGRRGGPGQSRLQFNPINQWQRESITSHLNVLSHQLLYEDLEYVANPIGDDINYSIKVKVYEETNGEYLPSGSETNYQSVQYGSSNLQIFGPFDKNFKIRIYAVSATGGAPDILLQESGVLFVAAS